jgi:hypothetical protein
MEINEEGVKLAEDRLVRVPESVYLAMQQLGIQLTQFDHRSGKRRVDLSRALPVCMMLADNDIERAAHLCQNLADALEDWGEFELVGEDQEFTGQPLA